MSMWTEYGMNVTGVYTGGPAFTQATSDLERLRKEGYNLNFVFGEEMPKAVGRGTRQMIFGLQMGVFYTSMFISALFRAQSATLQVEDAQEDYNRAVQRYGVNSEQAQEAARRLERVQLYVQRANLLATFSTIGLGMQLVQLGNQFLLQIPKIEAFKTSLMSLWAMIPGWGWALLIGGAIVGAGVGGYMLSQSQINVETNINISREEELEEALEEQKRRARYELRRSSGE